MPKPPSRKLRIARNVSIAVALAVAAPLVKGALHRFAASDSLVEFRKEAGQPRPWYMMRLDGVRMRHYDAKGLVTYAHCDVLNMASDRHRFDLQGVQDALYRGKEGEFRYSATHASYTDYSSQLTADGKVEIRNKDLDVSTPELTFDGNTNHLRIKNKMAGTLKGGQMEARNVDYRIDTGAYITGPVRWKGNLAANAPEAQDVQEESDKPTVWEIQGDTVSFTGKPSQIGTYTNAVATDGEIILIAPKVIHDRKTDVVTATGRVQYFSAKADLVADQCVVYRKEKRAILTGNVQMLVKPKKDQDGKPKVETLPAFPPMTPDQVTGQPPAKIDDKAKKSADEIRDSKTIRDFPTAVASAKIEYWYGKGSRRAVITGAPQARQELPEERWRYMWTNVAYYDGEKDTLKLVSTEGKKDTREKNSIGDDMSGDWAEVSTKEDDDEFTGHGFIGKVASLDDEIPKDKSKSTTPPVKPPPPAGASTGGTSTGGGGGL